MYFSEKIIFSYRKKNLNNLRCMLTFIKKQNKIINGKKIDLFYIELCPKYKIEHTVNFFVN